MTSGKYRILISVMILFLLTVNMLISGTTGKITGRAVDQETGEPLIGVTVIVKGTSLGAATDIDGYYVILSVPPGTQSLRVSMLGYSTLTINEVTVNVDQTSQVDIKMVQQAINAEDVVVVAERMLVKRDVSTSITAIQPEEIGNLPINSINDMVSLQAGVEEGLMVRGGTADQLLFQIDGVSMRDPRNNKPISTVALSSIQEVTIERGGFNAEYGQVRSGIVNIVAKEGSLSSYDGSFTVKYSPAQPKHFGISVYDPNSMWNRPYMDPAVCWTGTNNGAWDLYQQRQYPVFEGWNQISENLLRDNDPTNDLSPVAAKRVWEWQHRRKPVKGPDYSVDGNLGGPVPVIGKRLGNLRFSTSFRMEREMLLIPLSREDYKDYDWSLKLNSDIRSNMKLSLSTTVGKSYNVAMNSNDQQFNDPAWGINGVPFWNATDFMRTPYKIAEITNEQRPSRIFCDSWYSEADVSHFTLSAKLSTVLSSSTFYDISFENVNRSYRTGPVRNRDLTKRYEIVPGYFVDEAPFGYDPQPQTGLDGMFFGGHSSTIRDSSELSSFVLKGDLTSQFRKEHLVKAGFEFSYFDLDLDYGSVNPYFSDINYVKQKWNPYQFAFYVQDKIEAYGFIANIGVRLDISNPNTEWVDVDQYNKIFFSSSYRDDLAIPKKKADVQTSLSPRLGISHPITENSKLYFNYGHFKQIPAYEEIYRIGRSATHQMSNFGNPNLRPEKTVSYELGYEHLLFDLYLVQIAAFYNDVTNQQSYTQFISKASDGYGYFQADDNNYQDIRGLELTLRKSAGDWIRGSMTYTYQVVTQGYFNRQVENQDIREQKKYDANTTNFYQEKPVPQPRANANLIFITPKNFGPEVMGVRPLDNWALTVLTNWKAGEYVTYNPLQVSGITNNVQVMDYFNIDIRLNKSISLKFFDLVLFMEARNLLNTKRLSGASFYDTYDQAYYFSSLHLPESSSYDNIPGSDRIGEFREPGVAYQPIEQIGRVTDITAPNPAVIYYERTSKTYKNYVNGTWSPVENGRLQQVLDDKAYIDMPNNSSFDFLNPKQIFFGFTLSFKIN